MEETNKAISKYDTSVNSPALVKLSASCKAAARAKFDVYPSATLIYGHLNNRKRVNAK